MPKQNLTTAEAARLLGVSERRVVALINSGNLKAEKFGKAWAIDADSVSERLASNLPLGRPSVHQNQPDSVRRYTLMNKNQEVLEFVYDHATQTVSQIIPLEFATQSPVGACAQPGKPNTVYLSSWISNRYIPKNRIGLQDILAKAKCDNPAELLFQTFGQNLTDQYWFKPEGMHVDWHEINYFHNPYVGNKHAKGPGSGTPGMLPKWWEQIDGKNYLIKGSSRGDREPYAELLATKLFERLLEPHDYVAYSIVQRDDKPHSLCEDFIDDTTQLVTLREVMGCYSQGHNEPYNYSTYVTICYELGIDNIEVQLAKMIVCDFLMANADRHDMNLGLVRNSETLEYVGVAPIFDNGRGFYFDAQRKTDFAPRPYFHTSHPFSEYPSSQLALVRDFSWFEPEKLDGFTDEIVEVLGQNDLAPEWFPEAAAKQFEIQLERVVELKLERER